MSHPQLICMPIPLPVKAPDDVSDVTCPNIYQERVTVMTDPPAAIANAREAVVVSLIAILLIAIAARAVMTVITPIAHVFAIFTPRIPILVTLLADIVTRPVAEGVAIFAAFFANILAIAVKLALAGMCQRRSGHESGRKK
jgi:hypothetical protein